MTPRPFDLELQMDRHGAALRQLAGALVRDSNGADDAVHEVWIDALQRPPRHDAALGGWFATALHNVVRGWRMSERRRLRREAVAAQLRANEVEDHSTALAREELVHRLVAAVTSLDAPFREAIWQRYFEGLAPREIAVASGVPLATVKSRLQRGLGLLREKLGEREGTDWRAGLLVAFGWQEGVVGSGTAAATMWPGVLLMTAWMKSAAAVLVVVGAGFLWWSLREQAAPVPVVVVSTPVVADAVAADLAAPAMVQTESTATSTVVERSPAPTSLQPGKNATLRGRCVDEQGVPLEAMEIVFQGSVGDLATEDAWLREHNALPERQHATRQTTSDGTFVFEFLPPPPFRFTLEVARNDIVPMAGEWPTIAEGQCIDLGDVVCSAAARVTGRVIDEAGKPVALTQVTLGPQVLPEVAQGPGQRLRPNPNHITRTAVDGTFALRSGLPFGRYRVQVMDRRVAPPEQIELGRDRRQQDLTIVVLGSTELPTITGRVLDEAGQPVRAWVHAAVVHGERPNSSAAGADGRFVVRRPDGAPSEEATLSVVAEGFEATGSGVPIPWGTRDVELRLKRARGLSLRVVDEQDAPVLDYRVHLLPQGGVGWLSGDALRERAHGPFENGTATIPGIQCGKWLVIVDFPSGTPFLKRRQTIDFVEGGPALFTLRAETGSRRMLRVVGSDGEPICGTRVQLCDLAGRKFGPATQVFGERLWLLNQWNPNVVLAQFVGTTDAGGRVMLLGEAGRDFGLRILGPGNVLLERTGIRLDVADELVVTVQRGARLTGRITPPEAMVELRRLAKVGPQESFPEGCRPFLQLLGEGNMRVPTSSGAISEGATTPFEIDDDGNFDVAGLPPGAWRLQVAYPVQMGNSRGFEDFGVGSFVFAENEQRRLDLDLQGLLPGTLEGTITRNGQLLVLGEFRLVRLADERNQQHDVFLQTDTQGTFTYFGRPGAFTVEVNYVRALGSATLVVGVTTQATFVVEVGTLKVRVLDPAGAPVAGVSVHGPDDSWQMPATKGDGTTSSEHAPATLSLRVLPKRLLDRAQLDKVWVAAIAAGEKDPLARLWIEVGTATITAGETTTLELRLPAEWEK